jgi:thiosulfate dehydrogenase
MKSLYLLFGLLGVATAANAMDVSPYHVGQKLDTKQAKALIEKAKSRPKQDWVLPKGSYEHEPNADEIRYGIALLSNTAKLIGPKVADANMRYSGNSLNCTSCHLANKDGLPGTVPDGIPLVNVMNDYPSFRSRSMSIGSPKDRVNGCMTRSQGAGHPFPNDSKQMKAIIAYFTWLAKDTKPGQAMKGTGLINVKFPDRKADPKVGQTLYGQFCMSCHAAGGLGMKSPTYAKDGTYTFPPLAGKDSFNDGAGMSRLKTATRFIYGNMPLGTHADQPVLTVSQAYDIAAYVESLPRPNKAGREHDFPNPKFRPDDYPVPAYFKGNKAALEKAKYGPYDK